MPPSPLILTPTPVRTGTLLRLAEPLVAGPGRLEQIDISLTALPAEAPLGQRQRRRGQLRSARLVVEQEALSTWLAGTCGARLRARGVERLGVRLSATHLLLSAQLLLGGRRVGVTLRARPLLSSAERPRNASPRGLLLALEAVRVYGYTPVPTPAAGVALCATLLAACAEVPGEDGGWPLLSPPLGLRVLTPDLLDIDPLLLTLRALLPPAGYRLPTLDGLPLSEVQLREGRLLLRYEAGLLRLSNQPAPLATPTTLATRAVSGSLPTPMEEADRYLLSGEVATAAAGYRAQVPGAGGPLATGTHASAAATGDGAQRARLRLLTLLASAPGHFDEALQLAAREQEAQPAAALLALGAVESERGMAELAASRYAALSELPDNSPEELAAAAVCAAELLLPRNPRLAQRQLERAAAIPGGLFAGRAAVRLVEEYTREGRWQELANLEERLLSMVPVGPSAHQELQRRHLRLALLYLERLNAPARAEAELDKALQLSDSYAAAWELRARVFTTRGAAGFAEALRSLDRAAELSPGEVAAEIKVRAGVLAEREGEVAAALQRYQQALALMPEHALGLERLAALSLSQGHSEAARAALSRIVDSAPGGEGGDRQRRAALVALGRLWLPTESGGPGDLSRARGYLGRALALGGEGDADVLEAWVRLEEAAGNQDKAEKLLSRLLELPRFREPGSAADQHHAAALRLRHAEVLLQLARPGEAAHEIAQEVERQSALGEDGHLLGAALRLWVSARQAMGDTRGVREALERLVAVHPNDRAAQAELGRALLLAGDLGGARRHLTAALEAAEPTTAGGGSTTVELLEALVEVLTRLGDRAALLSALRALAQRQKDELPAGRDEYALSLGRLALLAAQEGHRAEAVQQLGYALALVPTQAAGAEAPVLKEARRQIGEAALVLERLHDAQVAWEPLLRGPVGALLALRLALLAEQEEPAEAQQLFQRALSLGLKGPDAAAAWHGIVRVLGSESPVHSPEAQIEALEQAAADPRTEASAEARGDLFRQAGDLRRQQGQLAEAVALYERALAQDARSGAALDALIAVTTQQGDEERLAEALTRKVRSLTQRPAERKVLLGQLGGLYAERLHRRDLARDSYRQALALDPSFRPALVFFADDAQERGDTGAALAHLKRLAALPAGEIASEERAEVYFRLAQLHRRAGRHEEAERQAALAIELCPDHAGALLLLEERYGQSERFAELVEVLRRRADAALDPLERQALLERRAHLLDEALGDSDAALAAYLNLVRLAPSPASCIRLAALVLEKEAFRDIYDVAPVVGRALIDSGRGAEAVPILEFATQRGAGEPLFALLAEAYESLNDAERAADAWSAAGRTADPVRHARALERAGRAEEALALWVEVAEQEPQLSQEARAAALALAQRALTERPERAAEWAERLLSIDPSDSAALAAVASHRGAAELSPLLSQHERRLPREEMAQLCLAAAQHLPDEPHLVEVRQLLLRWALARAPLPGGFLLLAHLEPTAVQKRALLQEGLTHHPGSRELVLMMMALQPAAAALTLVDQALAHLTQEGDLAAQVDLLQEAARLLRERGDRAEARVLLQRLVDEPPGLGDSPSGEKARGDALEATAWLEAALHERVALDLDTLTSAGAGSPADLQPTLELLRDRGWASDGELRALQQLYLARGDYAAAAQTQLRLADAAADPEELLTALETAGQHAELLAALQAFAAVHEQHARRLLSHAAYVAEFYLGERGLAAELTARAAAASGPVGQAALLYASAGSQWNQIGERERGAAAMQQALTLGGETTSGVLMALGDYYFERGESGQRRDGDWDQATRHYRRAIAVGQVPTPEMGKVRLRLAAIERRRGNPITEEQELAAAVEAGAGVKAWPQLAALFRAQGESARLGAALLAWADYEAGDARLALLRQAAQLISPSLLPRVDDELTKLNADDEEVRDRTQARLRQAGDMHPLAQALVHDVERSEGERRAAAARELAGVCEQLGDPAAAASAWRAVLESTTEPQRDSQTILSWLTRCQEAGVVLPADQLEALRVLMLGPGGIGELLTQLQAQAEAARIKGRFGTRAVELMKEGAQVLALLGDTAEATARWLRIVAVAPADRQAMLQARLALRGLCEAGKAPLAVRLCEVELHRLGPAAADNPGLRTLQAELLVLQGQKDDAIGQLEVVLLRFPMNGLVHALLGALLAQAEPPSERERGLPHLLTAAYAKDVEPLDAGECALLAAELLLEGMASDTDQGEGPVEGSSNDPQPLLARAADLLPEDPRPLEGLIRFALLQGGVPRALQAVDDQLRVARSRPVRTRLLEQRAALLRMAQEDGPELEPEEE